MSKKANLKDQASLILKNYFYSSEFRVAGTVIISITTTSVIISNDDDINTASKYCHLDCFPYCSQYNHTHCWLI